MTTVTPANASLASGGFLKNLNNSLSNTSGYSSSANGRDLLSNSLGQLQPRLASALPSASELGFEGFKARPGLAVLQQSESYSASFRREDSVDLQLYTQDGDRISLRFAASSAGELNANSRVVAGVANGGGAAYAAQSSSQSLSLARRESLSIEVVGELSEAERGAINELFDDLDALLDEFFAGDLDSALSLASSLSFDGSQLAALNFDASLAYEAKAIRSYETVVGLGPEPSAQQPGKAAEQGGQSALEQLLSTLAERARQLLENFEQRSGLTVGDAATSAEELLALLLEASTSPTAAQSEEVDKPADSSLDTAPVASEIDDDAFDDDELEFDDDDD